MRSRPIREGDVDASTFQSQIEKLAITLTNKVEREGISRLPQPNYVVTDLAVILRQAVHIYDLLYFLHSDEIQSNSGFRQGYSFAVLPLIRTMIDCLYNITALLEDPKQKGPMFRKSGYGQMLQSLDKLEWNYATDSKWQAYIAERRTHLEMDMRSVGILDAEARKQSIWPTLSGYIRSPKVGPLSKTQTFLKNLTFGYWAEYSSISHATFQGLKIVAPFFMKDRTPREDHELLQEKGDLAVTQHLARAAALLLCCTTELQLYFRFDGAHIAHRLRESWSALNVFPEVRELFDNRYDALMKDSGI